MWCASALRILADYDWLQWKYKIKFYFLAIDAYRNDDQKKVIEKCSSFFFLIIKGPNLRRNSIRHSVSIALSLCFPYLWTYQCHAGAAVFSFGQYFCFLCLCLNPKRKNNIKIFHVFTKNKTKTTFLQFNSGLCINLLVPILSKLIFFSFCVCKSADMKNIIVNKSRKLTENKIVRV